MVEEDSGETSYQYDNIYQLTSVDYPERDGVNLSSSTQNSKNGGSKKGKGKKIGHSKTSEVPLTYENFSYDAGGNRLEKSNDLETIEYSYNEANQMLTAGNTQFSYDDNGNRIHKVENGETANYVYNYDDMMQQVDNPDGETTSYGYDALNRRVYKADQDGEVTSFLYDGIHVLQEVTGTNEQKITAYSRAKGKIITRQEYNVSQGNNSNYQNRPQCVFH